MDKRLERAMGIEHHHYIVQVLGHQSPPRRDTDRLTNVIERHSMAGHQRLHAADTGNHLIVERGAAIGPHPVQNAQGAVIQGRLAPQQKCPALTLRQLVFDQSRKHLGPLLMPVFNALGIGCSGTVALRVSDLNHPITRLTDITLANLKAQPHQVVSGFTLVQYKEHRGSVQGLNRLYGDLLRIAGAHADQ